MRTNNEPINQTQEKTQHNKLTHTKSRENKTKPNTLNWENPYKTRENTTQQDNKH